MENKIEYSDVYPLFNLLDDKLQNRILKASGERMLKARNENLSFSLDKGQKTSYVYNLSKQLSDIPNIMDCQIFTPIMNKNEDVFSSRIKYEYDNSIIVIHHVASKRVRKSRILILILKII
ncbi:2535_t:CDS:2 [Cetraspora pellucida]|uniref:2535_t:CDS:1 n=1 Tax=Cetraspora pellucida TaxID=1433469 RepID=A0ACA9Q3N1_9GLOM|nr:2535_t:CDS:2 [Cetraspora pellucida]